MSLKVNGVMKMLKVILCCSAAMSTSLLVEKIKNEAINENIQIDIEAQGINDIDKRTQADIILLAPQVKYAKKQIEKLVSPIPVVEISMRDYGLMDGKSVFSYILSHVKQEKE